MLYRRHRVTEHDKDTHVVVRHRPALNHSEHHSLSRHAGCRMPAHNRPNIRVSSPRTAKSRSSKTRVRQSWNTLLSRWQGARLVRRTLTAAPRAVRIVWLAALVLAAFALTNLVYHVVR